MFSFPLATHTSNSTTPLRPSEDEKESSANNVAGIKHCTLESEKQKKNQDKDTM